MFFSEEGYPGLVIHDYRQSTDSVLQTCWMIFVTLRLESYPTDGRTDGHTDRRWEA